MCERGAGAPSRAAKTRCEVAGLRRGVAPNGVSLRMGGTEASTVAAARVGPFHAFGAEVRNRGADRGTAREKRCLTQGSETVPQLQCRDNGHGNGDKPTKRHDQPQIHSDTVS